MDGLRVVLIVVGTLAIGAVLIHGLWSMRKQRKALSDAQLPFAEPAAGGVASRRDNEGFDELGIGKVRTVGGIKPADEQDSAAPVGESQDDLAVMDEVHLNPKPVTKARAERIEPVFAAEAAPSDGPTEQGDLFAVETDEAPAISLTALDSSDDLADNAQVVEPVSSAPEAVEESSAAPAIEPEEVLVLNVVAKRSELSGAALLPSLLTLGFKFGEFDIFHRHEQSSGKGAVLFSLANMVKPGVFDLDKMESFTTQGVSLFMTLPNAGDPKQVFELMLKAAETLATELDAQVLDDQRSDLTKQKIQHYRSRIREFERRKLIAQ